MEDTSDTFKKVQELSGAIDENFLELAKALRTLQDTDNEEFLRAVKNSGLGKRKAYYLVSIDRTFSTIPVPKLRLKKIGWTKLNLLTAAINKQNYAEMLKAAESYTAKELEDFLAGRPVEEKKKSFLTRLDDAAYSALGEAFLRVGGIKAGRGWKNKRAALTALAQTVIALPDDVLKQYGVKAKDEPD
jgi:hypothetical protein